MKRVFCLTFAITLGIATVAMGHGFGPNGEGNPWFMPAISADVVPTIDGDLSDWAFMAPQHVRTLDDWALIGQISSDEESIAKDNFDVIMYGPAWIPSANQIIMAVHKVDDSFYAGTDDFQMSWQEDNIQWYVDADHGGELKGDSQEYQQNYFSPKLGGDAGTYAAPELQFAYDEPYVFMAMNPAVVEGTNGSFDMEAQANIFDHIDLSGIEASVIHQLTAEEIIGFSVDVADVDDGVKQSDVEFDYGNGSLGGEAIPDFFLMSLADSEGQYVTAVENDSWGRIKSALAP
jgi:hypothetical protein